MHAKPDLRVFLKWMIAGSGSVITDVIPLKVDVTHGCPMRFRLPALFLLITFVAIACSLLLPPAVRFGEAEFSVRVLPDGERLLNVTIPVENRNFLSVEFMNCDGSALGAIERNGKVYLSGAQYAPWETLSRGESVELKEYYIKPGERVGIQLRDELGRTHAIFHQSLDIESAWQRIDELPIDDSGG